MDSRALSKDGYIIDQRYTKEITYGNLSSKINGCGWIAAYNFLHAIGTDVSCEDVCRQMSEHLTMRGFFGTPVKVVMKYMAGRGIAIRKINGKRRALESCLRVNVGMLRYVEGKEPHFIAFVKINADTFRFFNSVEGEERHVSTMEDFFEDHAKLPRVRALIPVLSQ